MKETGWERGGVHLSDAGIEHWADADGQAAVVPAVRQPQLPAFVAAAQVQLSCRKHEREEAGRVWVSHRHTNALRKEAGAGTLARDKC